MAEERALRHRAAGDVRATLRAYVRWTLFADVPVRSGAPALSIPRLDGATISEADIYAARPGGDDPPLDDEGLPRRRRLYQRADGPTLVRGPVSRDPVGVQVGHAGSWRRYLEDEVTNQPAMLQFERETVRALVQRLSPRDQQAIWDLANLTGKEAAKQHRCSPAAIKLAARDALDRLLSLLYATSGQRSA